MLERCRPKAPRRRGSRATLQRCLTPLFWDHQLRALDLDAYPAWIMARTLMYGEWEQVRAARAYFGDAVIQDALKLRGLDERTRNFWRLMLAKD